MKIEQDRPGQHDAGHKVPAVVKRISQHCPEDETQRVGPPQSAMAISPTPAAPTRPSPARAGITPAVPRAAATETPAGPPILLAASSANPPDQTVTISAFKVLIKINKKELNPIIVTLCPNLSPLGN